MRIAFDAKRAFQNYTGLGNYSRTLLRTLSHYYPDNEYLMYAPKVVDNPRLATLEAASNVSYHFPKSTLHRRFKSYWRSRGIVHDLKADKIDIFHGLSNELPLGIARSGAASVVTIHDLIFERYPNFYPFFDRKIYHYKFKKACQEADKVVAISQQTKDDIVQFYNINPTKISVIYQSCEPIFFQQYDDAQKQRLQAQYQLPRQFILYVGTVNERKNLLGLVKAFGMMRERIPLVVVGDGGEYFKHVKSYAASAKLLDDIIFIKNINFLDLPILYQLASVFVLPSYFEGFGIPIIEALASATPVITSEGSCFPEAGGPHSCYINPDDTAAMATAIERVLADEALQTQMTQAGQQYVQRFREDHIASEWQYLYSSLM